MYLDRSAFKTACLYAVFASIWAICLNQLVRFLNADSGVFLSIEIWSSLSLVAVSACVMYLVTKSKSPTSEFGNAEEPKAPGIGALALVFIVLAGAVLLLGFAAVAHKATKQRDAEIERLQAIGDLKVNQVSSWLGERFSDAEMIRNDDALVDAYREWRKTGSHAARKYLEIRLSNYLKSRDYLEITIVGHDDEQVSTNTAPKLLSRIPELHDPIASARGKGIAVASDLYRSDDGKSSQVHLDIIAPLRIDHGRDDAVAVLRTNPNRFLFPFIQYWPIPSASAETLLFRREGDQVLFLNELRHRSDTALKLRASVDRAELLAAQVLRGDTRPGDAVEGVDYRGVPVLGVVKAVPGTSWFLVAKLDKDELYAGTKRDAGWIALATSLALVVAATASMLLYHRSEMQHLAFQRQEQLEKMRALQLLEAIAEGSADAIYAKDVSGRYLLVNREFCRTVGKPRHEIIGSTDTVLFPEHEADRLKSDEARTIAEGHIWMSEESLPTVGGRRTFVTTRGPLRDSQARIAGVFGIARDITDSKYQEREIRSGEARFRAIFDGVDEGIILYDLKSEAIVEINAKVEEMLGYGKSEMRSLSLRGIGADTAANAGDALTRWIERAAQGETPSFDWGVLCKNGDRQAVHVSMHYVDISGRPCLVVLLRNNAHGKPTTAAAVPTSAGNDC